MGGSKNTLQHACWGPGDVQKQTTKNHEEDLETEEENKRTQYRADPIDVCRAQDGNGEERGGDTDWERCMCAFPARFSISWCPFALGNHFEFMRAGVVSTRLYMMYIRLHIFSCMHTLAVAGV